jgi:hypothetical protein
LLTDPKEEGSPAPRRSVGRPRSKRKEGEPERVCDGCFNKLRFDCAEAESRQRELVKNLENTVQPSPRVNNSSSSSSSSSALFAGANPPSSPGVAGSGVIKGKLGATAAVMQDTMVALNERGEKLSHLAEKSEELNQVWEPHVLV